MAGDASERASAEAMAHLAEAAARLRARETVDEVLATAADEARRATGSARAWAAAWGDATLGPLHASAAVTAPGAGEADDLDVAGKILALTPDATPVATDEGLLVAAVPGRGGAPIAVIAVAVGAEDADAHPTLAALALLTGLALDTARVRELLAASSRTRERLLASVAHDLRNPLNTFAMGAGLLRDDLTRDTTEASRGLALLDRMSRATARMQGLVEDLAYASRAEAGQVEVSLRAEKVDALVASVAREAGHGVVAVVAGDVDASAVVMADRARVKEIVERLAICATKAAGEDGSLRLSAARGAGAVVFTARALGAGGAPARAPEEVRSSLALHVARGLLGAQGGSFWVDEGPSLVLGFTLPAAHAQGPGDPSAAPATSPSPDAPAALLEPSEYVRTELLRRVAHDIAAPVGIAATILDELVGMDRPPPELIAMAQRALRRLARISEHLALVAELESGGLELERAPRDLRELVERAADDARAVDGRKDVSLTVAPLPAPLLVSCEERLLLPAVREVIGNALRFASSRVGISLERAEGGVELRVDDDGPGFSEEERSTIGRRFASRSDERGGARRGGLGLSLSMAAQILRAHGGAIRVEPGKLPRAGRGGGGAAVIVTLPQASSGASGGSPSGTPAPSAP